MRYYRSETERRIDAHARREIGKRYGEEIARYLQAPATAKEVLDKARDDARLIISSAEHNADDIRKKAEEGLKEIAQALALPPNLSSWSLLRAVRERAALLTEAGAVSALNDVLSRIQRAIAEGMALQRMAQVDVAKDAAE